MYLLGLSSGCVEPCSNAILQQGYCIWEDVIGSVQVPGQ